MVMTSLFISPKVTAPAEPYTFQIRASADTIGKILGDTTSINVSFTPTWLPLFSFAVDTPIITAPAGSLVNVKIELTNEGNADMLIMGKIQDDLAQWGLSLSPAYVFVSPDQSEIIAVQIGIPADCVNCIQTIQINFSAINVYRNDRPGSSQSCYLLVDGE
jgi:hypothetical protein